MPFSNANNSNIELVERDLNYIYQKMIQKAVKEYTINDEPYFQEVQRYESKVGSIINGVIENLNEADLVIADLTGSNRNVMYELGVRHALKRGTIIIAQSLEDIPSDLRDYMVVIYNYSSSVHLAENYYESFKKDLHKSIDQILTTSKNDSPVLDYLKRNQSYIRETEVKDLKELAIVLKSIILEIERLDAIMIASINDEITNPKLLLETVKHLVNNLHSKIGLIKIPPTPNFLFEDIEGTKNLLNEIIQFLSVQDYFGHFEGLKDSPFPPNSIEMKLNYELIDPVVMRLKSAIRKVKIKDLFSKNEIIYNRIFKGILEYIENEANRIGVYSELEFFMKDLNRIIKRKNE